MSCQVCTEINCTDRQCKDIIIAREVAKIEIEVEELEKIIEQLYPESYGSNHQ